MARRIISKMPACESYWEPCIGGGSVYLNRTSVNKEIISDINPALINLWKCCQEYPGLIISGLLAKEYNEFTWEQAVLMNETYTLEYENAGESYFWDHRTINDVSWAINYIIAIRMSRGGLGLDFAWSERQRGGQPGEINSWHTFINKHLPMIIRRIKNTEIRLADMGDILFENLANKDALIYLDPPYLPETRKSKKIYQHEMSKDKHIEILNLCLRSEAKILISGYDSRLYQKKLESWGAYAWDMPNHSGQGKTKERRLEWLWYNEPCEFPEQSNFEFANQEI